VSIEAGLTCGHLPQINPDFSYDLSESALIGSLVEPVARLPRAQERLHGPGLTSTTVPGVPSHEIVGRVKHAGG
jgi:hypothetical protein